MKVNLKKPYEITELKVHELKTGKTYLCLYAPWRGYIGKTIVGVDYDGVYGVWLDINNAVLSKITPDVDVLSFKEIETELNEV